MRLQHEHSTAKGQTMLTVVNYTVDDLGNGTIQDVDVYVIEKGVIVCEISKLLDDAEGNPLAEMLEAINWEEMYKEKNRKSLIAA